MLIIRKTKNLKKGDEGVGMHVLSTLPYEHSL